MKKIILLSFLTLFLFSCSAFQNNNSEPTSSLDPDLGVFETALIDTQSFSEFDFVLYVTPPTPTYTIAPISDGPDETVISLDLSELGLNSDKSLDLVITLR